MRDNPCSFNLDLARAGSECKEDAGEKTCRYQQKDRLGAEQDEQEATEGRTKGLAAVAEITKSAVDAALQFVGSVLETIGNNGDAIGRPGEAEQEFAGEQQRRPEGKGEQQERADPGDERAE